MSNSFDAKLAMKNAQSQEEEDEFSQPTLTKEQILQQKVLQQQKKDEERLRKRKELEQKVDQETKDILGSKRNGLFDEEDVPAPIVKTTSTTSVPSSNSASTAAVAAPKQEPTTASVPTTANPTVEQKKQPVSTVSKPNKTSNLFDEDDELFSNTTKTSSKNLSQAFDQIKSNKPVNQVTTSLKDLDINDDDLNEIEQLISTKNLPTLSQTSRVAQPSTSKPAIVKVKAAQVEEDLDEDLFAAPKSKTTNSNLFQGMDLDSYISKNKSNTKTSSSLFDD